MENELVDYIWYNYTYYIDLEYDYLKIVRARVAGDHDHFRDERNIYRNESYSNLDSIIKEFSVKKRQEIAESILRKYEDKIYINRCSRCHKVVRTERSERCNHCGHTWYGENPRKERGF